MGKQGETLKKKIPSDFQKLVCSHCLGMVDKQMVLAVSILLTGKLQTLFTDSLNTAQLLDLTLCPPGEQEKGPCHTKFPSLSEEEVASYQLHCLALQHQAAQGLNCTKHAYNSQVFNSFRINFLEKGTISNTSVKSFVKYSSRRIKKSGVP